MSKKLSVCTGKTCKKNDSTKQLKQWGKELVDDGVISKVKKVDCLGICKKAYAIEFKGEVYSCSSKDELEEIVTKKNKNKKK